MISQAFSRRETNISMLDARAGSPSTAAQLMSRHSHDADDLHELLSDWERWSAELLESHVSFPVLSYFRSQHDNQSWVAALTTILDSCCLAIARVENAPVRTARLTFAMARHAVVDLCHVFHREPLPPASDRLPPSEEERLEKVADVGGLPAQGPRGMRGEVSLDAGDVRALRQRAGRIPADAAAGLGPAGRRPGQLAGAWRESAVAEKLRFYVGFSSAASGSSSARPPGSCGCSSLRATARRSTCSGRSSAAG